MNLDWSIVWQYRHELLEGALVTILLTVLTMVIAVPGGILLAAPSLFENSAGLGNRDRLRRTVSPTFR